MKRGDSVLVDPQAAQALRQVLQELEAELASLTDCASGEQHNKRACALRASRRYGRYLRMVNNGRRPSSSTTLDRGHWPRNTPMIPKVHLSACFAKKLISKDRPRLTSPFDPTSRWNPTSTRRPSWKRMTSRKRDSRLFFHV